MTLGGANGADENRGKKRWAVGEKNGHERALKHDGYFAILGKKIFPSEVGIHERNKQNRGGIYLGEKEVDEWERTRSNTETEVERSNLMFAEEKKNHRFVKAEAARLCFSKREKGQKRELKKEREMRSDKVGQNTDYLGRKYIAQINPEG